MVVTNLGPGRFYGSGLPRPWFHADVKFSEERVDPPPPVLDPLLCWAREAHWSMGGLSFQRHRLQGRIEGSVKKLRAEAERAVRRASRSSDKNKKKNKKQQQEHHHHQHRQEEEEQQQQHSRKRRLLAESSDDGDDGESAEGKEDAEARIEATTTSPRRLRQLRRRLTILDEDTYCPSGEDGRKTANPVAAPAPAPPSPPRRKSVRKLGEEFDRVAASRSPKEGKKPRV